MYVSYDNRHIHTQMHTEAAALNGEKSRLVEEMPAEIQGSQSMSGLSASSDSLTDVRLSTPIFGSGMHDPSNILYAFENTLNRDFIIS